MILKTINGVTTYYNTRNGVILSQTDGTNTMYFQYDTNGTPFGFIYNGTQYFYMTNQMGDVIAVTDSEGNVIVQYVYDEWGKLLNVYTVNEDNAEQIEAANANPLRYRGYYYDSETGYYYLQSRYYDASICRFINADIPEIAQMSKDAAVGINLFAYCNNDPVNNSDPTGYWIVNVICGVACGAIFGALAYLICKVIGVFVSISKKARTIITSACVAVGATIGAFFGPKFLAKHAPNLLQAIHRLEKQKFSIKAFGPNPQGNIFGIVISNTFVIMLHAPHPKYNEYYFHIQVEAKLAKNIKLNCVK